MSRIGYGQCRRLMVKKILDHDGRANPFPDNLPGKDWWYAFLKRHPDICMRAPHALQVCRAKACSPEAITRWYIDFEQFLEVNSLLDKPSLLWNCDESGFALCPKTSKVLAPTGAKTVYYTTSSEKGQITTLACINAAGGIIPPMHIFAGVRFSYNPMEGCVDNAYFGKSDNRWITSDMATRYIPPERPVQQFAEQ